MIQIIAIIILLLLILIYWFISKITSPLSSKIYKYAIVGGGLSGLHIAHKLAADINPTDIIVIEKESRLGGRIYQTTWHGTRIVFGAGILRERDHRMFDLCKSLKIPVHPYKVTIGWHSKLPQYSITALKLFIAKVKNAYNATPDRYQHVTFLQFLRENFPNEADSFVKNMGYTDFLDESVPDVIYGYPIEDVLLDGSTRYGIEGGPGAISDALAKTPFDRRVSTSVTSIDTDPTGQHHHIYTSSDIIRADRVIMATTIGPTRQILRNSFRLTDFLDEIGSIPFIRAYTHHPDPLPKLPNFNVSDTEVQRYIPSGDHILMSIYADNKNAKYWHDPKHLQSDLILSKINLERTNQHEPPIPPANDFTYKYWPDGVHFYKPAEHITDQTARLAYIQKNMDQGDGIYICGEMLSVNQGWMEGAIESSDRLFELFHTPA